METEEKERITTLDRIAPGEKGVLLALPENFAARGRLTGMGFCKGEAIECVLVSPPGDPRAYLIRGAVIALRQSDAGKIRVRL